MSPGVKVRNDVKGETMDMMNRTTEHRLGLILMFLLILSACGTVGEYSQPDTDLPGT